MLLASDIPAARNVMVDGQTGLLFRMGDVSHLAAMTLRAAADPDLRAEIGVQARQAAASSALETVVAAYEAILEEVVARRRG